MDCLLAINVEYSIIGDKQSACTLILVGIATSWKLAQTTIHNNGLLGEGTVERFYLNEGRTIGNFYFSIVPMDTLGVDLQLEKGQISFWVDLTASAV